MTHDLGSQVPPQRFQTQASTGGFHYHTRILGVANGFIAHGFNPPSGDSRHPSRFPHHALARDRQTQTGATEVPRLIDAMSAA
jgi:hypothetical protein